MSLNVRPDEEEIIAEASTSEQSAEASTGSSCTAAEILVPQDCETIKEALRIAVPGQTIRIAAGEYAWEGRIDLDKIVHIIGHVDSTTHAPLTILSGRCVCAFRHALST
jgi:hypothetical protein